MKKYRMFIFGFLLAVILLVPLFVFSAPNLANILKGRFLLAVEDSGSIWYINPLDNKRYSVTFNNSMSLFRKLALGITNKDLETIPVGDNLEDILLPAKYCQVEYVQCPVYLNPIYPVCQPQIIEKKVVYYKDKELNTMEEKIIDYMLIRWKNSDMDIVYWLKAFNIWNKDDYLEFLQSQWQQGIITFEYLQNEIEKRGL